MFRTANASLRLVPPVMAAVASISAFTHATSASFETNKGCTENNRRCRCETADNESEADPSRVLIVGSGLTGCLAALRIQQRLANNDRRLNARPVDITMVERATYPSGRFAATATYRGSNVADIGAQVLSTINPLDHRALGGHGVEVKDIQLADMLVQKLKSQGVIVRANDEVLGETEERMLWEGLWMHYFAPSGMVSILWKFLDWAGIEPIFGVRIDSIDTTITEKEVHVKGVNRGHGTNTTTYSRNYDCVVLCIPAPDALGIHGVNSNLSKDSKHVLDHVRYDQRMCEAHIFSADMRDDLAKAFGDKVELMVDEIDDKIQYISWQNRKLQDVRSSGNDATVALVVHGKVGELQPLNHSLDRTLSKLLGKSQEDIASHRLYSKSIPWQTSQMITPMEAVVADPPTSPAWQCIVGNDRRLVIAGDFVTQSSFLGCCASADAAARIVVQSIVGAN